MRNKRVYELTSPDGTFIACGTVAEIAERRGVTPQALFERASRGKCRMEHVGDKPPWFICSYADLERYVFGGGVS